MKVDAIIGLGEWLVCAGRAQHSELTSAILRSFPPLVGDSLPEIRQLAASRLQVFGAACPADVPMAALEVVVPALLPRMTDSNGPARRAAQGALYFLLSFQHGSDRAEKLINVLGSKLSKRGDGASVAALMAGARRSIVRLREEDMHVQDELRREGLGGGRTGGTSIDDGEADAD